MKKYASTIRIWRENCKMLNWSKTRGRRQHDASTHESLSGANKRTINTTAVHIVCALWAKSELKKKQTKCKVKMELVKCSWQTSSMYNVLTQTHELGDSYYKGATQRNRLIDDWRWKTAATPKEDCAASHRYSSSSPCRWSQVQQQQQSS